MKEKSPYKSCPLCGRIWHAPADMVCDQTLKLNGYQADVPNPEKGLLLFTHESDGCYSTIGVYAIDFRFMHDGIIYPECHFQQADCEGRCLDESDLEICHAHCCMAWVRDVIQYIRRHEVPLRRIPVRKKTEAD